MKVVQEDGKAGLVATSYLHRSHGNLTTLFIRTHLVSLKLKFVALTCLRGPSTNWTTYQELPSSSNRPNPIPFDWVSRATEINRKSFHFFS